MTQAILFLLAALVFVPLAMRLGLGSVLGYLMAGIAIGPQVLGLVSNPEAIVHVSELGVVLMLFVIGLELEPKRLWSMRAAVQRRRMGSVASPGAAPSKSALGNAGTSICRSIRSISGPLSLAW